MQSRDLLCELWTNKVPKVAVGPGQSRPLASPGGVHSPLEVRSVGAVEVVGVDVLNSDRIECSHGASERRSSN